MTSIDYTSALRDAGLTPTIQRLAIFEYLHKTRCHPTADEALAAVRRKFPSISRATVYNTLDALTKAGIALRLNVDPTVARYDADLGPHAHFRCRACGKLYDVRLPEADGKDRTVDGHRVESIRTYAYGICAACLEDEALPENRATKNLTDEIKAQKRSEASSVTYAPDRKGGE